MVNLDKLVYARLAVPTITNIVGAGGLYPLEPEQELTLQPYIVFTVEYGEPWNGIDTVYSGSLNNTVKVDCRAIHLDVAKCLADAVYCQLHGWRDLDNGIQIARFVGHDKNPAGEYFHLTMNFKVVI